MGIQTHLGPQLLGTVKNNNPNLVTANTPNPAFLGTGQTNGYRNLGVGDGTQFGIFTVGTSTPTVNQTGLNIASGTPITSAITFYPGVYTTGPSGNQQFQPMVLPSGSYISAIVFDITTSFTFGGSGTPTMFLNVNLIGSPASTYQGLSSAQTLIQHTGSATGQFTQGRYQVGANSGFTIVTSATGNVQGSAANALPLFVNTGPSDTLVQCTLLATGGTGTTVTAGCGYLGINYVIRNPDGSWYPQTPTSPIANPPVITY